MTTTSAILTALTGIVSAVLLFLGTLATAKRSSQTTREGKMLESWQSQFDNLQEEVDKLRAHLAVVESKLDDSNALNRKAVNFIDRVGLARLYGREFPIPDGALAEAVDMSLWVKTPDEPYHD